MTKTGEYRVVYTAPGLPEPLEFSRRLEAPPFTLEVAAKAGRVRLELACSVEIAAVDIGCIKKQALGAATKMQRQLCCLFAMHDLEYELVPLDKVDEHCPPQRIGSSKIVCVPGVASAGVAVGRPNAWRDSISNEIGAALKTPGVMRPAEEIFFEAEKVSYPPARLVLLWSGLVLFLSNGKKRHSHKEIDEFLLRVDPNIPRVQTIVSDKPKIISVVQYARDGFVHLAEKTPGEIEAACARAADALPWLRRAYARLLVEPPDWLSAEPNR